MSKLSDCIADGITLLLSAVGYLNAEWVDWSVALTRAHDDILRETFSLVSGRWIKV